MLRASLLIIVGVVLVGACFRFLASMELEPPRRTVLRGDAGISAPAHASDPWLGALGAAKKMDQYLDFGARVQEAVQAGDRRLDGGQ